MYAWRVRTERKPMNKEEFAAQLKADGYTEIETKNLPAVSPTMGTAILTRFVASCSGALSQ